MFDDDDDDDDDEDDDDDLEHDDEDEEDEGDDGGGNGGDRVSIWNHSATLCLGSWSRGSKVKCRTVIIRRRRPSLSLCLLGRRGNRENNIDLSRKSVTNRTEGQWANWRRALSIKMN